MYLTVITTITLSVYVGMLTCNPGKCPIFPTVSKRHKSCYETSSCDADSTCRSNQKCCENSCGIKQCFDIDRDPMYYLEKCPVESSLNNLGCTTKSTKFCFKNNCKRYCHHKRTCNPAPSLLVDAVTCHKAICSSHTCQHQGEVCFVDYDSNKSYCKCPKSCNNTREYICGTGTQGPQTYINKCHMDKEACEIKKSTNILYTGRCIAVPEIDRPVLKPTIKKKTHYYDLNQMVIIRCYSDRTGLELRWVLKRSKTLEVYLPTSFVIKHEDYKIQGRKRGVLALYIKSVGYGSYGTYACKQFHNNTEKEEIVHVQPTDKVPFNRSSCMLPPDVGSCEGSFRNYYYNNKTKTCTTFRYRGCKGNANNFQTLHECQIKCAGKKPTNHTHLIHYGEQCGVEQCKYYAKCTKVNNESLCMCPEECSLIPKPICASDGQTYLSVCAMRIYACRWAKPLVSLYEGECIHRKTTLQPTTLCELRRCPPYAYCYLSPITSMPRCQCEDVCNFQPDILCASNMQHYLNECFMRVESCHLKRLLTVLKKGLCIFKKTKT